MTDWISKSFLGSRILPQRRGMDRVIPRVSVAYQSFLQGVLTVFEWKFLELSWKIKSMSHVEYLET